MQVPQPAQHWSAWLFLLQSEAKRGDPIPVLFLYRERGSYELLKHHFWLRLQTDESAAELCCRRTLLAIYAYILVNTHEAKRINVHVPKIYCVTYVNT